MASLRKCAAGTWGLFGQNDDSYAAAFGTKSLDHFVSNDVRELVEMVGQIETIRARLGYAEPHPLCQRFKAYRALRGQNVPGEPKLAKAFFDEIVAD
jgi:hypothetical protein